MTLVIDDPGAQPGTDTRKRAAEWLRTASECIAALRKNLAIQDYAVLWLAVWLLGLAWLRASGPSAPFVRTETATLLATYLSILAGTRGELLQCGPVRTAIYRLGTLGTMAVAYLALRLLLPALNPVLLDAMLNAIDTRLFGKTPSIWLDPAVNSRNVEWFAFFYYSHYALLASHVVGSLLFDSGRRRYELLLATALTASIGHTLYACVPGVGPYAYASLKFTHVLSGGPWWSRVQVAVASAGAGLDIFPSMHTGFSVLVALHAIRHRNTAPFSWTWLPTVFVVMNIVIATLFLRWHYGVDVLAGSLLAWTAHRVAVRAWHSEGQRELTTEVQPVWERAWPDDMTHEDRILLSCLFAIQMLAVVLLLLGAV